MTDGVAWPVPRGDQPDRSLEGLAAALNTHAPGTGVVGRKRQFQVCDTAPKPKLILLAGAVLCEDGPSLVQSRYFFGSRETYLMCVRFQV